MGGWDREEEKEDEKGCEENLPFFSSSPQHMRQESQGSLSTMKTSAAMGMSAQEPNCRICFNWSPLCEGWGVVEREISTKG